MPREFASTRPKAGFTRTRGDDRQLGDLAGHQHGVVARWQLLELGLSEDEIESRLRSGRLRPLFHTAYSVGHQVGTPQARWLAAVLAAGPEALLSHHSAAALWGIRPTSRAAIDVTLPHHSRSSARIHRHLGLVPADERTTLEAIPTTSVHRTILDLAATEPLDTVKALIKEAEYRRHYDRLSLPALIERYRGRRGVKRIRLALKQLEEDPPGRTVSPLEERFLPFLRRYRLTHPHLNAWILLGNKRFQVDAHWPEAKLIVELDSWKAHGTRSVFRSDRGRDRALLLAGYHVMRLTWAQLDDEPDEIAADLRAFLGRAAATST